MEINSQTKIYHPRNPQESSLWQLLNANFAEFESCYDRRFARDYSFYRLVVSHVVNKYLECGDLHEGFARVRCPDCHHEYLLAYSCRGRWFCPSCHSKKVIQFAHHLKKTVIFPVPHRQYVFSIPKIIRKLFLYNRKLLGKLSQCASKSITKFLRTVLGKQHGIPGVVMVIQTFGDYARWHPHLHALVADGLFLDSGYFYVMPKVDIRRCAEFFRAFVLKMLKKEGLIDDAFIKMIMKWGHNSGFSVHHKVRIKPEDEKGIENLSQYIIRNTFSNSKIQYIEKSETVLYRSKMSHGKNKKNFQIFDPLEFIAAITQHIPEKSFQLVRYYGWYSNRMRGDRKKQEQAAQRHEQTVNDEVIDIRSRKPRRIPPLMWRECIKKIWEVDPLICKKCGGEMNIISFIYERTVIKKILVHLHLYTEPKQRAPPTPEPKTIIREYESYDDG